MDSEVLLAVDYEEFSRCIHRLIEYLDIASPEGAAKAVAYYHALQIARSFLEPRVVTN
jgi:hypothetical protein